MVNKDLLKEIKLITLCSLGMNVLLVVIAVFFMPVINAITGAAFGTLLLAADMFLLLLSVQSAANGAKRGRNGTAKAITFYILRMIFILIGLYVALILPFVSIMCAAVPLFYPKIIYPAKAILIKKEG